MNHIIKMLAISFFTAISKYISEYFTENSRELIIARVAHRKGNLLWHVYYPKAHSN